MRTSSPRPGPAGAAARGTRVLLAVGVFLTALLATPAHAGWWDDAGTARETSLVEIRKTPARWRDVPVLLRVTFDGEAPAVRPFFTQFAPTRWRPLSVRRLDAASDTAPFQRLFVRRGGKDDARVAGFRPGRELLVRAVVRDEVGGEPWLEVLAMTLPGDGLTPEEQAQLLRADRFLAASNPAAAADLFRAVLAERPLDEPDRIAVLRKLAIALHEGGEPTQAIGVLTTVLALRPDDPAARAHAVRLTELLARRPAGARDGARTAARTGPTPPVSPTGETPAPPRVTDPPDDRIPLPGGARPLVPPRGLDGKPVRPGEKTELPPLPPPDDAGDPPPPSGDPSGDPAEEPKEDDEPPPPPPPPPLPPKAKLSGPK